jgi:hypothetical protein
VSPNGLDALTGPPESGSPQPVRPLAGRAGWDLAAALRPIAAAADELDRAAAFPMRRSER